MRLVDYGKTAATFVDTQTNRAIRIALSPASRARAARFAPAASDRWHAQLAAYQIMPPNELLTTCEVALTESLAAIISRHGGRVVCAKCGEDIINEREVRRDGQVLCRACVDKAYYAIVDEPNQIRAKVP